MDSMEHEYSMEDFYQSDDRDMMDMSEEGMMERLIQQEHMRMVNEYSITNECIKPTLKQSLESVWVLFALCLALRCLSLLRINQKLLHLLSAIAGFVALWHFYESSSGYVILLCVAGYLCFTMRYTGNGGFISLFCLIFMLSCEKYFVEEMEWNKIRGSVMVVAMKLIYFGFERNNKVLENLNMVSFYGYVLNPASVIFGPFITYSDYMQLICAHQVTINWALHVARTVLLAAVCLLWSTCGTSYVFPMLGTSLWLDAFKDANAFRFSTYFVSFVSESTCLIMGVGTLCKKKSHCANGDIKTNSVASDTDKNTSASKKYPLVNSEIKKTTEEENFDTVKWRRPVANPLAVEIPRSLVEVVTNWNLPMHFWLKEYVFKTSRHLGVFPAILLTYFGSSLLHGLNFQLSVILLSIGIFAYVENSVRKTLSSAFNACIEARRCRENCKHQYKQGNYLVFCANLAFGFVAVWNLAYLGCLFDNDPEIQEKVNKSLSSVLDYSRDNDDKHHLLTYIIRA